MKPQTPKDFNNSVPYPLICYLPDTTFNKNPGNKSDSLKVEIKMQLGYPKSDPILMYVPVFNTGSPEVLLKFLTLLDKIIKGQSLTTGTHIYAMTNNLLAEEALCVFEQQAKSKVSKTTASYKSVIEGVTTHLFPSKALQLQKRYLHQGLYNPQE